MCIRDRDGAGEHVLGLVLEDAFSEAFVVFDLIKVTLGVLSGVRIRMANPI